MSLLALLVPGVKDLIAKTNLKYTVEKCVNSTTSNLSKKGFEKFINRVRHATVYRLNTRGRTLSIHTNRTRLLP